MRTFAALATMAAAVAADTSNHWAVIMAGSNTYSNYRHQADAAHAFKIMRKNGIPRDQIIHMSYDDIAQNAKNPYPGQLFNQPTETADMEANNVYDASEIDYRGDDVNKDNFFKVLMGDDSAPGPVLKSNADSKVFVFFVDHGGAGLICTPTGPWIYADELNTTLQNAKEAGMFKELVFYLETCESGSMFPSLTADGNIWALTASNATLSSYGAYCGRDAVVGGKSMNTCLADLFSINWMNDTSAADDCVETLEKQALNVTMLTDKSPVQQFGDRRWIGQPLGDFQGICEEQTMTQKLMGKASSFYKEMTTSQPKVGDVVDSRDNDLAMLTHNVMQEGTEEAYAELQKELDHRQFVDMLFTTHFSEVSTNAPPIPQDFDCLRLMVNSVEDLCGPWSSYSLKYVRKLANACDTQEFEQTAELLSQIGEFCAAY